MDTSGVATLQPFLIQHYTSGGWQGTLEVQERLDGIFKLLRIDPSISLIQPLEVAQFLGLGETSTRWTRPRHFPDADNAQQLPVPTTCGPCHDGAGHILTLYICNNDWALLDPLWNPPCACLQRPRIVGPECTYDCRRICRMPLTSLWWAIETPFALAWRGSGRRPSGGHGDGCYTIGDRIATTATGVFECQP